LLTEKRLRLVARERALLVGVLGLCVALRIVHLKSAMASPLTYQPGPDEDYYLHLGQAVAQGAGTSRPEFTFMDPGYGYLLGALFKLLGVSLLVVYSLQVLLDTATAYAVFSIGVRLNRPRSGLIGATCYAVTSTAILFTTTLLKETWVASFYTWWVVSALALVASERKLAWLAFGVFCGLGIALRSTLWEMGVLAMLLPLFAAAIRARPTGDWLGPGALVLAGMITALLPWSIRNEHANSTLSPLPLNGGIVLHQAYNERNPDSSIWIPDFVTYSQPKEIWRGYAAEAARRTGHSLTPVEVDRYWRTEALKFITAHPLAVLHDVARKSVEFISATEIPNNRFSVEERMFSPVLAWLPSPIPWLLGLGIAGLLWLALEDRRWPIVAAPVLIAWLTFAMFWAEDRFRFHVLGVLALGCGYLLDRITETPWPPRNARPVALASVATFIVGSSFYLGSIRPPPPVRWDHIVWGYINMGKIAQAQTLAQQIVTQQPYNAAVLEALGFTSVRLQQLPQAKTYLLRAIALRPTSPVAHYNLARVLLAEGDREQALQYAQRAESLAPSSRHEALIAQIRQSAP
jgi:4-amino-4-deoxy-L-arabinose transferase-like glycosyltransferase